MNKKRLFLLIAAVLFILSLPNIAKAQSGTSSRSWNKQELIAACIGKGREEVRNLLGPPDKVSSGDMWNYYKMAIYDSDSGKTLTSVSIFFTSDSGGRVRNVLVSGGDTTHTQKTSSNHSWKKQELITACIGKGREEVRNLLGPPDKVSSGDMWNYYKMAIYDSDSGKTLTSVSIFFTSDSGGRVRNVLVSD